MTPRPLGDTTAPPDLADVSILTVLHALSDRTRAGIVQELLDTEEQACGTFHVEVAPSTLSHHFKVLREAGLIHQREVGRRRLTTLRLDDMNRRFPGLVSTVMAEYAAETQQNRDAGRTA